MQRIVVARPGGLRRLEVVEESTPEPGAGMIRVATRAVGVNFADCVVRMGLYQSAKKLVGWPITPGFEFSGVVDAVGQGADSSLLGQRVLGVTLFGGYSSHVVVPPAQVFPIPARLNDAQAAGFPAVSLTAWYALVELCRLRPSMRVLIHAAAGGVGLAATQIARHLGARVTAVVGAAHKRDACLEAGATQVIVREDGPWSKRARELSADGYDVVLDPAGGATLRRSYRLLRPTGRLVVYGSHTFLPRGRDRPSYLRLLGSFVSMPRFSPLDMVDRNVSVLAFNLSYLFERMDLLRNAMTQLLGWAEAGVLGPPRVATYPLREAARAQAALQSGETTGKLVLLVQESATEPQGKL